MEDDDKNPPLIRFTNNTGSALVGVGYRESHGLINAVRWDVADAGSGVGNVAVVVF